MAPNLSHPRFSSGGFLGRHCEFVTGILADIGNTRVNFCYGLPYLLLVLRAFLATGLRSKRLNLFWACFKARGFSNVVPSESVASCLIPRSTPIADVAVRSGALCVCLKTYFRIYGTKSMLL
jgi:hypothetical protein